MLDDNKVQRWELGADACGQPEVFEDDNGDYVEYDDYAKLEADNTRLRAIVDRLPKTADGVPAIPGDTCYVVRWPDEDTRVEPVVMKLTQTRFDAYGLDSIYSTRAAAEQAAKETP